MPTPDISISAHFDAASADGLFILGDSLLGDTDVLGGDLPTEIGDFLDARRPITINRGRNGPLDPFTPGTCSIPIDDQDRTFDSLNASSPYAGSLVPGKRITITAEGVTIYDGRARRWAHSYRQNAASATSLLCDDALGSLGRRAFAADWTATAQLAGTRIGAVLDLPEVAFGANRDLDTGVNTLQADAVTAQSNVLTYLQLVARSDLGRLFARRTGQLAFVDRASIATAPILTFTDDGTGVDMERIERDDDLDTLITRVTVDRAAGTAQTVTNSTAEATYDLVNTLRMSGLLLGSDLDSTSMANYLLGIYGQPEPRITEIEVNVTLIADGTLRGQVLALELGDVVSATFTPLGIGDPVERLCIVERVRHTITSTTHLMTVGLSSADNRMPFILGDAVYGVLGGPGVLAY